VGKNKEKGSTRAPGGDSNKGTKPQPADTTTATTGGEMGGGGKGEGPRNPK